MFITLVHELAEQVPLGKLYRIDGTDIPVDHQDDDAQWNYDHAEDDFYYGYGCCLVTAANNIPVTATFTSAKKVDQETAMRVTTDALAVGKPIWMLGDAEFDMLDWHDRLLGPPSVHTANRIERFFEKYDRFDQIRIPTACPELNPCEGVWDWSKVTDMNNATPRTFEDLISRIRSSLTKVQRRGHVQRWCFHQAEIGLLS